MNSSDRLTPPGQLDWGLIQSFLAVTANGSLSAAALALGSSQPTLSRQIARLEAEIGAALFERAPRGLRLTVAGQALVEPARRMQEAAQALSLRAAAQDAGLAGTVRLTASEIVAGFVLPPLLLELRQHHPEIQIELVASDQIDDLLTREADIAVRMTRPEQGELIGRKISDYPLGLYAHRDYVTRCGGTLSAAHWQDYEWVGLDRSPLMLRHFNAQGFAITRGFFPFRCDNQIVGWQAVRAGLGIGAGLMRVAEQMPELVRVLPELTIPPLPVWLTAHRELRDTPRLRAVYDFLAVALG